MLGYKFRWKPFPGKPYYITPAQNSISNLLPKRRIYLRSSREEHIPILHEEDLTRGLVGRKAFQRRKAYATTKRISLPSSSSTDKGHAEDTNRERTGAILDANASEPKQEPHGSDPERHPPHGSDSSGAKPPEKDDEDIPELVPNDTEEEDEPSSPPTRPAGKKKRRSLEEQMAEVLSIKHMMTYSPKHPLCDICNRSKMQRKPKKQRTKGQMGRKPLYFGDHCAGDMFINRKKKSGDKETEEPEEEEPEWLGDARAGAALHDRATGWLASYPQATRSQQDTTESFLDWEGPDEHVKSFHCDNGSELLAPAKAMGWRTRTSTPGVPQTNGLADRMVRKVKEGTRANIIQSGLSSKWWPEASMQYTTSSHNIQVVDGDSPLNRRLKEGHFKGQLIPFGMIVDFLPQPDTKREPFDSKTLTGVMIGYHFHPGGKWSGDHKIAEYEPLRKNIDSLQKGLKVHRVKEATIPQGRPQFWIAAMRQALKLRHAARSREADRYVA